MSGIKVSEEFFKKFGKKFPPESFLAREGEPGATMFLIQTGRVAVIKQTPAGEKILASLSDGDFFGEMAIMGLQDRRAASVKTLAETTVLELSREAFEGLIRRSPEIAMSVIRSLTERIRDANGKLSALAHKNDWVRISAYLQHLANDRGVAAPGGQPGRCFTFKVDSIATAVSVPQDTVSQYFGAARKARMLGVNGAWIWVPYPSYLIPFAEYVAARL
jgi:CRP/FNR family transcriptional regulator